MEKDKINQKVQDILVKLTDKIGFNHSKKHQEAYDEAYDELMAMIENIERQARLKV
ncbi:hypothetical protein LCGC14_0641370 [marine sediment metagenome]|uniref:Uncharacterized protein n=1 Tax=marine sediment metagenome TaxID=412755 RepID=A0A0F9RIG1_9ZZZZ